MVNDVDDVTLLECSEADKELLCHCGENHIRGCLVGNRLQSVQMLLRAGVLDNVRPQGVDSNNNIMQGTWQELTEHGTPYPGAHYRCAQWLLTDAQVNRFQGRLTWAEADFEVATRICQRWIGIASDLDDLSRAHGYLGIVLDEKGDCDGAAAAQKARLAILEQLGDLPRQADALKQLGFIFRKKGSYSESAEAFERWLALVSKEEEEQVRDLEMTMAAGEVANAYLELGKLKEALSMWQLSLETATRSNNQHFISAAYGGLGVVYERLGMLGHAVDCCQARLAMESANSIPQPMFQVVSVGNVGALHSVVGAHDDAFKHLQKQLQLARRCVDIEQEASALLHLGHHHLAVGSLAAALECLLLGLSRARAAGNRPLTQEGLLGMGLLRMQLGELEEARRVLAESVRVAREMGSVRAECAARLGLARVLERVHETAEATTVLEAARETAAACGDRRMEAQVKTGLGRMLAVQVDTEASDSGCFLACFVMPRIDEDEGAARESVSEQCKCWRRRRGYGLGSREGWGRGMSGGFCLEKGSWSAMRSWSKCS